MAPRRLLDLSIESNLVFEGLVCANSKDMDVNCKSATLCLGLFDSFAGTLASQSVPLESALKPGPST